MATSRAELATVGAAASNTIDSTPRIKCYWKRIFQTVSGYSRSVTPYIVSETLKLGKDELLKGLVTYKPYSIEGYTTWAEKTDANNTMKGFIHDLSRELNLDAALAQEIMCNYLMFEFYGKMKEFWHVTRIGTTVHLKESIFNFYMAERMFFIKTWRHIFEHLNQEYKFSGTYKKFLKGVKIEQLQKSIIKQLQVVVQNMLSISRSSQYVVSWVCRNTREQTELILLLTLTISHRELSIEQMVGLVKLFMQTNFGTLPRLFECREYSYTTDVEALACAEVGCFIVVLGSLWDKDMRHFWKNQLVIEMDSILLNLHLDNVHAVVVLGWLAMKFKTTNGGSENESTFLELFEQQPFVTLHIMLEKDIFKNSHLADIVAKAIHKMFDELCLIFNDRKMLYEKNGSMCLVAQLLNLPQLAEISVKARGGIDTLIEIAWEAFPFDFFSFSHIMRSLLGLNTQCKEALQWLFNVPSFLSDITSPLDTNCIVRLTKEESMFSELDLIVFPEGTVAKSYQIYGQTLLQYRGTYSYFALLECYVTILFHSERKFDEDLVQRVIAGYGVVMEGIRSCTDMDLKVTGLERLIEKINNLPLVVDGPLLHYELIKLYFQVQITMIEARNSNFFDSCPSFLLNMFFLKLKPEVFGRSPDQLLVNQIIFEDRNFMTLLKDEVHRDDHDVILMYIKILHNSIKMRYQKRHFQLSGITYVLNFVFAQHTCWPFKDSSQLTEFTLSCLTLFHHILQADVDDLNDTEKEIFQLCHHAFMHNRIIVDTFLQYFLNDKFHLIFIMERETNWSGGPALQELKCLQMKLALLLILMKHNKTARKCYFYERLPFIIKRVAFYLTNSYSPVIAQLSCRFLEKLAQDRFLPMLALLELDHYQVQSLFLEKLRDPLEGEDLKLTIIDLINTCISNQSGMTAAFFNLKCFKPWDELEGQDTYGGDSMSEFIVDYLQNIKTSHEFFKNPLQLGILRLLYNLWRNHRESLIENVSKMEDFWPIMISPFFCDYVQDIEIYTTILTIVHLEISSNIDRVDKKLITIVDKFVKDKDQLKKWINFVLQSSKNHLELLKAWTECLVLAIQITPNSFEKDVKILLIDSCLNEINSPDPGLYDLDFVCMWIQVLLSLIKRWPLSENQPKDLNQKILCCMRCLNSYYKCLPPKLKEIFLSAIKMILADLQQVFSADTKQLLKFLYPFGCIVDLEYEWFITDVRTTMWTRLDDNEKTKRVKPWLIIILICDNLLSSENLTEFAVWFSYRRILPRVMESVEPLLKHRCTLPFAKLATNFLVTYVRTPLVGDFLKLDLHTFYYKMRPPSLLITLPIAITEGIPVDLREWWLIFITLIKLNSALLDQMGNHVFSICRTFITDHDLLLKDLISLVAYTVDMSALTLVCECIKLVHRMVILKPDWCLNETKSYKLLMEGIQTTMNATMISILGYKKINFYKILMDCRGAQYVELLRNQPNELLVSVLNKLIEIIYWGSNCLKQTKPFVLNHLHSLHCLEYFDVLIDFDFSFPRFEQPIGSKITYGTLLCLCDYLCKIFNQLASATTSSVLQPKPNVCATKIFEHCTATYENIIGFFVFFRKPGDVLNEELSFLLHYDMSEFSDASSIISQLDYNLVKNALEAMMMFLAVNVFYTLRNLEDKAVFDRYVRQLSSDLQFFYEFARKMTSELYSTMVMTPNSTTIQFPLSENETDIITRYVMTKVKNRDTNDIADSNFILAISQFLMEYCRLSN